MYGIKLIDGQVKNITSNNAVNFWPTQLKEFLEKSVVFNYNAGAPAARVRPVRPGDISLPNSIQTVGKPQRIISAINHKGQLKYLCQWRNTAKKLVPANVTSTALAIPFLEKHLKKNHGVQVQSKCFLMSFNVTFFCYKMAYYGLWFYSFQRDTIY